MLYKLYTDSNIFQKEYSHSTSDIDIARDQGIHNRIRKLHCENYLCAMHNEYRADKSGFKFTITYVFS